MFRSENQRVQYVKNSPAHPTDSFDPSFVIKKIDFRGLALRLSGNGIGIIDRSGGTVCGENCRTCGGKLRGLGPWKALKHGVRLVEKAVTATEHGDLGIKMAGRLLVTA